MTPTYLLETSFIIEYLHHKKHAKDTLDSLIGRGKLTTSSVCIAELCEGAIYAKDKEKAISGVENFIKAMDTVWSIDITIAKIFGSLRGRLRRSRAMIEDIDIFIAATCLAHDITLVTFNRRHFQKIPGLEIYR